MTRQPDAGFGLRMQTVVPAASLLDLCKRSSPTWHHRGSRWLPLRGGNYLTETMPTLFAVLDKSSAGVGGGAMAVSNIFSSSFVLSRSRVSDIGSRSLSHSSQVSRFSPLRHGAISSGFGLVRKRDLFQVSINSSNIMGPSSTDPDSVPMPIIVIDQDSDSDATIVQLSFGDRLGALVDTMKALKDLGLDVSKGTVTTEASVVKTKLFITQRATGRKIEDPDMLERIRLTIINNLLKYHPESSEQLAMGEAFGVKPPEKKLDVDIATHIYLKDDGPKRSLLYIETADRSGLLMEVIKIMTDININVESAEIDTEGLVAKDRFHVSYRGAALNTSLSQVLINCLRYYLRRPETDEDSY